MSLNSIMKHDFSRVPQANIPRSVFNRSCATKTTFSAGYLVPVFRDDALPGDTFVMNATMFARLLAPLNVPVMDNIFMDVHWFSVPYRLLWSNFVHFMGEKHNPSDVNLETTYVMPTVAMPAGTGCLAESLFDYLGVPIGVASLSVNALYSRAYNLIYNTWYKAQDIIDDAVVDTGDGADTVTNYVLRKRGKRHDYFTSCLPTPQFGANAVTIPLGTEAPVLGIGKENHTFSAGPATAYETGGVTASYANYQPISAASADQSLRYEQDPNNVGYPYIRADLSNAAGATINELREAFATQQLLEQLERGGHRYCEVIMSAFGVKDPMHAVLARPEYLGGTTAPVRLMPVANTSDTATTKQGTLAAFGTVAAQSSFSKSFTEHSVILGIVSVRADLNYQKSLDRAFTKSTRYDYYWPAFANLGEQAVLTKELFCQGTADDAIVFGYQEAYAEYRYKPSLITGQLNSHYATPLDVWHLAQELSDHPTLSQTFIEETPPMARIKAVEGSDFVFDSYFNLRCARPMPVYSVPGLNRL